jgi:hypothetical protein
LLAELDEEGAASEDRVQARSGHSVSGLAQPDEEGAEMSESESVIMQVLLGAALGLLIVNLAALFAIWWDDRDGNL